MQEFVHIRVKLLTLHNHCWNKYKRCRIVAGYISIGQASKRNTYDSIFHQSYSASESTSGILVQRCSESGQGLLHFHQIWVLYSISSCNMPWPSKIPHAFLTIPFEIFLFLKIYCVIHTLLSYDHKWTLFDENIYTLWKFSQWRRFILSPSGWRHHTVLYVCTRFLVEFVSLKH